MTRLAGLRGSGSRSSRATTVESETVDLSPHAIHISDVGRSPTKLPRKPGSDSQSLAIIVANAKGAADSTHLYRLLQREKDYGEFDPMGDFDTDYFCNDYIYNVRFIPPSASGSDLAYLCFMQHVCLVFTYDASSRESWDEMAAACERMRSRCKDGVLPFLARMIAAMGEAEAFATQRDCLFIKFSPATGRGICDAVGSLVELVHGARDQYAMDQEGYPQRYKRAEAFQALFPS
ncbi:hypothetical protein BDV26DRAFT_278222 [Aspergillus bertholletiae]|uniref:Uncharacterized protein n=1 Tax=Aspergillus bertholletiae TaxID=1226010 RepID=A0A5N7BK74_9EURO|nr:hypothetical protein BDV26DRAFT_278222 [Aspergillus bertholletiae]